MNRIKYLKCKLIFYTQCKQHFILRNKGWGPHARYIFYTRSCDDLYITKHVYGGLCSYLESIWTVIGFTFEEYRMLHEEIMKNVSIFNSHGVYRAYFKSHWIRRRFIKKQIKLTIKELNKFKSC